MSAVIDLSRLPPPSIIEVLDYEAVLARLKSRFGELAAALLPGWNPDLESDVAVTLLEAWAYEELGLRARINDAARSNLLYYAAASDLDQLAAFYGVERLEDESDEALRRRVQQRIVGWANAGGAAHYRWHALSASSLVRDAAVSSPAPGLVRIGVLSREGDGTPDAALLDAVRAAIMADDVRVLTDTVEVVPASVVVVDVTADVWLYPETPAAIYDQLVAALPAAVESTRGLGVDLTRSWLIGQLQQPGVYRVDLVQPAADVVVDADQCVALGRVEITLKGRAK